MSKISLYWRKKITNISDAELEVKPKLNFMQKQTLQASVAFPNVSRLTRLSCMRAERHIHQDLKLLKMCYIHDL